MKCPVCGTEYSASSCPLCGYEDIFIVGLSEKDTRRELNHQISMGKEEFFSKVQVGIVLYHYDVTETTVTETEERVLLLSRLSADGNVCWLPRTFGCCSERARVEADIYVKIAGTDREFLHHAEISNIIGEGEQEIGLQIDKNLQFKVNIRSTNGRQTSSQPQYLFA